MGLTKMVDIGNERIRVSKIKQYISYDGLLYIRNSNELRVIPDLTEGLGFFEKIKYKRLNRATEKSSNKYTEFWDEVSFPYVRIIMFDGSWYDVCSDLEIKNLYDNTKKYLLLDRPWNYDRKEADLDKAQKSLDKYKNLNFVNYDILAKLDEVFKTVK